jgi:hypothetical protein
MTKILSPKDKPNLNTSQGYIAAELTRYLFTIIGGVIIGLGAFAMRENLQPIELTSVTTPANVKPTSADALVRKPAVAAATTAVATPSTPTVKPETPAPQNFSWDQQAAAANTDGKYDRLAKCETGGNWQHRNSRFAGGVGFMNRAWSHWKLPGMPDNAALATKAEQIVVAERIRWELPPKGSFHGGKWGCAGAAKLP